MSSVRIKFNIDVSISDNSNGSKELGTTSPWIGINDLMDDGGTFRRHITAGASNVLIDMNGLVNGRFIAIKTDQDITVKKNSTSGEPWDISALGYGATDGLWLMTTKNVTALYVSNPGAVDAVVTFSIAGKNT